jgi:hypothetical protein
MGIVYRAVQVDLERPVALKLITPELAQDSSFRSRFERESRLAAAIEHPNIIPVYDAGEIGGHVFIAMRLVDGRDLRAILAEEGALDPGRASGLIAQVASALDAAHAGSLVHRDVKPGNILVERRDGVEVAYLTDFGLTKQMGSKTQLTQSGQFVGTVDYIAPEQARGAGIDARTDVYSLGAVLFEALTGEVPFPRDSSVNTLVAHLNDPPPSVTERSAGEVPEAFEHVVHKAMAKDPDRRFASAGDLGRAAIAASEGRKLPRSERSVARGAAAPAASSRMRRVLVGGLALLAVAAVAAGAALVATQSGGEGGASDQPGQAGDSSGGTPPPAGKPDSFYKITADSTGVQSLGEFQPGYQGLLVATKIFGKPNSKASTDDTNCRVQWRDPGVLILFVNLGGGNACTPQGSLVQYFALGGEGEDADRWQTADGLKIGDPLKDLHRIYPVAHPTSDLDTFELPFEEPGQRVWSLIESPSPYGEDVSLVYLAAIEASGVVTGFAGYVGNAGD